VASNKAFGRWGEVFADDVVAAMIDRLVHRAKVITLKADSYRLKDRDLGRTPRAPALLISTHVTRRFDGW
jgi:DNA replication protein DnaC